MIARRRRPSGRSLPISHRPGKHYQEKDPFYIYENVEVDSDSFWNEVRHEPLTKTESAVYAMVDSIQNVPLYKTYVEIIEIVLSVISSWKFW